MSYIGAVSGYSYTNPYQYYAVGNRAMGGGIPPVTPVDSTKPLPSGAAGSAQVYAAGRFGGGSAAPLSREALLSQYENDAVAMAVRMRIEKAQEALGMEAPAAAKDMKSAAETMEEGECQTCANRKYQDGSDDPGVSFKTPGRIAPENAAAEVMGHEMEHVTREQSKAAREGRKVVQQSVTLRTDICPECGRTYISGGTTRTVTKAAPKPQTPQREPASSSELAQPA